MVSGVQLITVVQAPQMLELSADSLDTTHIVRYLPFKYLSAFISGDRARRGFSHHWNCLLLLNL